jgi:HPt (histidine-containing phosphotransfer) domain-containing protein
MMGTSVARANLANYPAGMQDGRTVDLVHLARMTLGDRSLEREVLQLFVRQASLLLGRMQAAEPDGVGTLAHTLKGSARGIGAWRVAEAAEAVELAFADGPDAARASLSLLTAAVAEARALIDDLLRAH